MFLGKCLACSCCVLCKYLNVLSFIWLKLVVGAQDTWAYLQNVNIPFYKQAMCQHLNTLPDAAPYCSHSKVLFCKPIPPPPDYLINYWLMPQTCWRQPSTQGQGALVSSVRAGDEDLDGRACQWHQDIKHNGFVVIGLILLSLWRQQLFFAVQRHLAENYPDWQSRAEKGAGSCSAGYRRQWTLRAARWLCPLKCANSSVWWVQWANTEGHRDLVNLVNTYATIRRGINDCQSFASTLQSPHSHSSILEKIRFGEDDGMLPLYFSNIYEMIFKWLHQQLYLNWLCLLFPTHIFAYS